MKRIKSEVKLIRVLVIALLLALIISCSEFQTETFNMASLDTKACTQLADTLSDTVSTVILTKIDTNWTEANIPGFSAEILDTLEARNIMLNLNNKNHTIITPAIQDTNYVELNGAGGSIVFFADDQVDLQLIDENGNVKNPSKKVIPLETLGGCPIIKVRLEFGSSGNKSLLKIIKNEQTVSSEFHLTVFKN